MTARGRAATCSVALMLILSACGLPGQSAGEPTGTVIVVAADLPTLTATAFTTPSPSPSPSPIPTATVTAAPTATSAPTETATVTPTAEPTVAPTPTTDPLWLFNDTEGAGETVSATASGVRVAVRLAAGTSLAEREWFAVEGVGLNRQAYPDAADRLAEAVLRAHWHAWMGQSPDRAAVTYAEFAAAVARGEDLRYEVVGATCEDGSCVLGPIHVDPRLPVALIYTDEPGPIYIAEGSSYHLSLDEDGSLRVAIQVPPPVRRYYDRHLAEDPAGARAFYTSYVFSPAAALHVLSLSAEFQRSGVRVAAGAAEASRLALCQEFEDVDDRLSPCQSETTYQSVVQAQVRME